MITLIQDHLFTMIGTALGVVIILHILRQQMRPSVSIAWVLAIVLIPYVGVPLYVLIGGRKFRKMAERKSYQVSSVSTLSLVEPPLANRAESVLRAAGMPPARCNNDIRFIDNGEEAYEEICAMIQSAERTISIMTFILGRDDVGRSLVKLLSERAREGIEVRLLLDALGCMWTRGSFVRELRDAGGQVATFLPILPVRRKWSANLRNHRKMVIVDGSWALVGGMNLGIEYMGPKAEEARWVDTAMTVSGSSVLDLKQIFIADWNFATNEGVEASHLSKESALSVEGTGVVQVVTSGPDVKGEALYDAILSSIYEARKRIWIASPYFIPDEGLMRALVIQANLGVDVRIILPAVSNHFIADLVRGRFLRRLVKAGATIFTYEGGMTHAKHLVFDDSLAVTGSMNFDMRSLYFNYEVAMFAYSLEEIEQTAEWMSDIAGRSRVWSETATGPLRRIAEDVTALVSPLL